MKFIIQIQLTNFLFLQLFQGNGRWASYKSHQSLLKYPLRFREPKTMGWVAIFESWAIQAWNLQGRNELPLTNKIVRRKFERDITPFCVTTPGVLQFFHLADLQSNLDGSSKSNQAFMVLIPVQTKTSSQGLLPAFWHRLWRKIRPACQTRHTKNDLVVCLRPKNVPTGLKDDFSVWWTKRRNLPGEPTAGFIKKRQENMVCRLHKCLNGLKQASCI